MPRCSAYEGSKSSVKLKELSWFHFLLEKPDFVRQWMHNIGRAKNWTRHIFPAKRHLHNVDQYAS